MATFNAVDNDVAVDGVHGDLHASRNEHAEIDADVVVVVAAPIVVTIAARANTTLVARGSFAPQCAYQHVGVVRSKLLRLDAHERWIAAAPALDRHHTATEPLTFRTMIQRPGDIRPDQATELSVCRCCPSAGSATTARSASVAREDRMSI
jgi:hypothetical protein